MVDPDIQWQSGVGSADHRKTNKQVHILWDADRTWNKMLKADVFVFKKDAVKAAKAKAKKAKKAKKTLAKKN